MSLTSPYFDSTWVLGAKMPQEGWIHDYVPRRESSRLGLVRLGKRSWTLDAMTPPATMRKMRSHKWKLDPLHIWQKNPLKSHPSRSFSKKYTCKSLTRFGVSQLPLKISMTRSHMLPPKERGGCRTPVYDYMEHNLLVQIQLAGLERQSTSNWKST